METITVTHEGQEIQVPIDNLKLPDGHHFAIYEEGKAPDGFMPTTAFQSEVERSVKRQTKGLVNPEAIVGDDDFFRKAAQKRGIELSDDLKPVSKIDPEVLSRYKSDWAKDELEPIRSEADQLREQNTSLRRENVAAKTQAALLPDLKPEAFKPHLPGTPSTFEAMMAHFVKFDEEGKAFFQADPQGMPEYDIPKGVLAFVQKHNKELLADKRQGGSGFNNNGTGGAKVMTRSNFESLSPADKKSFAMGGGQVID